MLTGVHSAINDCSGEPVHYLADASRIPEKSMFVVNVSSRQHPFPLSSAKVGRRAEPAGAASQTAIKIATSRGEIMVPDSSTLVGDLTAELTMRTIRDDLYWPVLAMEVLSEQ